MKRAVMSIVAALALAAGSVHAQERQVGLFYFLWLGEHGGKGPYDVTKILAADPDAGKKPDSALWGPWGSYHHWGEPLYGYYYSNDEWVVRRHMKLIMQAGVDFLFFDTTNAVIYEKNAKLVMRVLQEYHDAGWRIPKVMFYTNTASGKTVRRIYDAIYKPGFAKDTWFALDGRPVIVAKEGDCDAETKAFFTVVKSQWPNERAKRGGWPWMDFTRPQRVFPGEKVAKSVMNVSVAQHPTCRFGDSVMYGEKGNWGRAFHNGANDPAPGAWTKGYNFQEQWNRAHEAKPDIVLVTGWNEWIAGRWKGRPDRPVMFVDCANFEYSRDIEMMRGGYGDNFFLLLRENVRRFKGVADDAAPNPSAAWKRYRCFADSGMPRNHPGYGTNYVNRTQRNVPLWIDVSHDAASVSFRVKTQKPIAGRAGAGDFMRILVNGKAVNELGEMKIDGDEMRLKAPRKALGLPARGGFRFGFKFVDSTEPCRNPLDWYDHGVVEPLGRVEFTYCAAAPASPKGAVAHIRPDAEGNLYKTGATAVVKVSVENAPRKGTAEAWADDGWTNVVWRRTFDLSKETSVEAKLTRSTPGSLRVHVKGRGFRERMDRIIFGVDEIAPLTPRPADFEAYWRGELARLERVVPIAVEKERAPTLDTPDHTAYYVSFATFNGGRVYGLLLVPKGEGRFPALVNVPGAGPGTNTIFPSKRQLVRKGWITLLMNVHGIPLTGTNAEYHARYKKWFADYAGKAGEPRYQYVGYSENREAPFYHRTILGMTRAIDWLAREPYADPSRFVYYGCSQGGGFGLYLSALYGRFAKSLILCPNKCDMLAYREGRQPGSSHIMNQKPENRARAEINAPYHDNCNFARMIRTPVRMVYGTADDNCQTVGGIAAFNSLASKDKELQLLPGVGHGWHVGSRGYENWLFNLPPSAGSAR